MDAKSKKIAILAMIIFSSFAFSVEEKKISLTEAELQKKIDEEVAKKIESVKNKSVVDLTKEILAREQVIRDKEKSLKIREEDLEKNSKELERQVNDFKTEQDKIIGCVDKNQSEQNARIGQLVKMISDMKPTKAAEILSVQDSQISVLILSKIDPVKASKIFNLMDKEISARLQKEYLHMKK